MGFLDFLRGNTNWLAAGFLLAFSSSYGQTYFISIFAGEIMAEFGLTHGQWGGIFTIGTTMSAILMVWAGGLADALRLRVLAPVILLFLAASCVFMARVHVAWALVAAVFCLRFAGQGMAMHLSTVAMARWFSANRGRALAIAAMGFSVAQAGLPVIFVAAKGLDGLAPALVGRGGIGAGSDRANLGTAQRRTHATVPQRKYRDPRHGVAPLATRRDAAPSAVLVYRACDLWSWRVGHRAFLSAGPSGHDQRLDAR